MATNTTTTTTTPPHNYNLRYHPHHPTYYIGHPSYYIGNNACYCNPIGAGGGNKRKVVTSLFDQHYGHGLIVDELEARSNRGEEERLKASGISEIQCDDNLFQVYLDVSQFHHSDVSVHVIGNSIIVDASHDEKEDDHGLISRSFKRRYILPDDVKPENITCEISADGILHITARRNHHDEQQKSEEIIIPIIETGQPAPHIPIPKKRKLSIEN